MPQLAEDVASVSLKDIKGQHGIVFFVEASHTSTTCPSCGWFKENQNVHYSKDVKNGFKKRGLKIFQHGDYYHIHYTVKYEEEKKELERKIITNVDRYYFDNANKGHIKIKSELLNKFLTAIFTEGANEDEFDFFKSKIPGFSVDLNNEIFEQMLKSETANSTSWKAFVFAMNRLFAIRNFVSEKGAEQLNITDEQEMDFLHCPRCGFDTRKDNLFKDGDAVGAYNIALKGKLVLDRLQKDPENFSSYISKYDWMKFAFKEDY